MSSTVRSYQVPKRMALGEARVLFGRFCIRANAFSVATRRFSCSYPQNLPYIPDAGVTIRTFNILRGLSIEFNVTALCFRRPALGEDRPAKEVDCSNVRKRVHSRFRRAKVAYRLALDHLRSALRREFTLASSIGSAA